jgi:RNA polymerase sigma-70 factor (ECF subfamily)
MQCAAVPLAADNREADDEADVVRAAQHDRSAFGLLYERYVDHVYAYLRSRTSTDEDAADLTQQVFLQALNGMARYEYCGLPFRAWLFRIARNLAINFHQRRRPTVTWDLVPERLQPTGSDDPALQVVAGETLRLLFASLDPHARELVLLRFAAQLTTAEIAAVIGISEAAARMRLVRILRTLREEYRDDTPR